MKLLQILPGIISLALFTQACGTVPKTAEQTSQSNAASEVADKKNADYEPKVQPGIELGITVMASGQKEIGENPVRVNREGRIALPMIGGVDVAGLTLAGLNSLLEAKYSDYFVDPEVVATFLSADGAASPWGYVTVLGRVKKPGRVPLPASHDLTVSAAIQQAGGFDSSAKSSAIRVTRKNGPGKPKNMQVDLNAFASGDIEEDKPLKAGDVVYVPERLW